MITLNSLITNAPASGDSQTTCSDWFAQCKIWAESNNRDDVETMADTAIYTSQNETIRSSFRIEILSILKAIQENGGV